MVEKTWNTLQLRFRKSGLVLIEISSIEPPSIPDVYFSGSYGRLDATTSRAEWLTISDADGQWQMPLAMTSMESGFHECISPYGYSGIYVAPELSLAQAVGSWNAAKLCLAERKIVSVFLRFSPLDEESVAFARSFEGLELLRSGTTYLVSIDDPETMWTRMEGRARTAVRKSKQSEMTSGVRRLLPEDVLRGSSFRKLYENTMGRVGAANWYLFDDSYYAQLVEMLSPDLYLAEVEERGQIVASSIVMRHQGNAHYHLSGSDPDAARRGANSLLIWSMMEWCSATSASQLHLGGGVTESDGLSKFKRSFGGQASDFFTGRVIIDEAEYLRLSRMRAMKLGVPLVDLQRTDYFPAYRASLS